MWPCECEGSESHGWKSFPQIPEAAARRQPIMGRLSEPYASPVSRHQAREGGPRGLCTGQGALLVALRCRRRSSTRLCNLRQAVTARGWKAGWSHEETIGPQAVSEAGSLFLIKAPAAVIRSFSPFVSASFRRSACSSLAQRCRRTITRPPVLECLHPAPIAGPYYCFHPRVRAGVLATQVRTRQPSQWRPLGSPWPYGAAGRWPASSSVGRADGVALPAWSTSVGGGVESGAPAHLGLQRVCSRRTRRAATASHPDLRPLHGGLKNAAELRAVPTTWAREVGPSA